MSKLYLALFLIIAVLPALNAQRSLQQQQSFITTCITAFKSAQTSAIELLDVLEAGDKTEIVKAVKAMAPQVQELGLQCNLKPIISPIRSLSNPENCVKNIETIKSLVEKVKAVDTTKTTITTYVLVVSSYGAFIGKIPKLLSDCAPSN